MALTAVTTDPSGNQTISDPVSVTVDNIGAGDPLFTGTFGLQTGSPAIDVGTETFLFNGEVVLTIPPAEFSGTAPDLGAFEFNP